MKLIIVTGATGSHSLAGCLESVASMHPVADAVQLEHWVVIDGEQYRQAVEDLCAAVPVGPHQTRRVIQVPHNTGRDGGMYLCHRIIAAMSYLIPADAWMQNVDEDTRVCPHHLQAIVHAQALVPNARWGYTLRQVVDTDTGERLSDTVESMGLIRITCLGTAAMPDRLVDTNCYVVHSSLARELAPLWGCTVARPANDVEADRKVLATLAAHEPRAWCTREFTVEYAVGNRPDSVRMAFFRGAMTQCLPWDPARGICTCSISGGTTRRRASTPATPTTPRWPSGAPPCWTGCAGTGT